METHLNYFYSLLSWLPLKFLKPSYAAGSAPTIGLKCWYNCCIWPPVHPLIWIHFTLPQIASISFKLQLSYIPDTPVDLQSKRIQIQSSEVFWSSIVTWHLLTCYKDVGSPKSVSSFHKAPHSYVEFHFYSIRDCVPYLKKKKKVKVTNMCIDLSIIFNLGEILDQKEKFLFSILSNLIWKAKQHVSWFLFFFLFFLISLQIYT